MFNENKPVDNSIHCGVCGKSCLVAIFLSPESVIVPDLNSKQL